MLSPSSPRLAVPALITLCLATTANAQWAQNGVPVCTVAGYQEFPTVVSDGAGGMIVAWQDGRSSPSTIYAQRMSSAGIPQWAAGGVLVSAPGGNGAQDPVAVPDGQGGAIIAWEDGRNFGVTGIDIYAQRISSAGVVLWTANGVPLCTAANNQEIPRIISDNRNSIMAGASPGAIVVWQDERNSPSGNNTDIYVQAIDNTGAARWTANGVAVCTAANIQRYPELVTDGVGLLSNPKGAIITWEDFRGGTNPQVFSQRVSAAGAVQWTADGVALCTSYSRSPKIVYGNASGSAIVAWTDSRVDPSHSHIYAQKISGGVPQWTANGVPVCTASGYQQDVAIVTDQASGAVVAWNDSRDAAHPNFYAQHVDGTGAQVWTLDGVALCSVVAPRFYLATVPDGAGGALAVWCDERSGVRSDVYAQHVDASGAFPWGSEGLPVSQVATVTDRPQAIPDGSAGLETAWADTRNGNYDMFAARVFSSGVLGIAPGQPASAEMIRLYPNPAPGALAVSFDLPAPRRVTARIFDASGRLVRTLARAQSFGSGAQTLRWDERDEARAMVPDGLYFVSLHFGDEEETRKVLVVR